MDDLTFLDKELGNEYGASDAILKAVLPGDKVIHISDAISPFKFLETCPLLYHAFEYNAQNRLQASIEASSEAAIISLARYCYTGSYLAGEPDGESILLLQHAETYKIAEDFDVPELQFMAHGNFSCQIEFACCLPNHPRDLLDTIRFIYRHFASDEARRNHNLIDTLLNYCVAVYLYHKLSESLDFLTAVHEIPAFRQDLCRTNITRNFEDDCAAEIIRLPSSPMGQSSNVPTTLASRELPSAMLYDLPRKPASSDMALTGETSAILKTADECRKSTLSGRRNVLGTPTVGREISDQSKHSVLPFTLSEALEKYNDVMSSDIDDPESATAEETLRKYKRARIEETTARLEGRAFPEAGPSSERCIKQEKPGSAKVEEDFYWEGAFGQNDTQSSKIVTEGTSHSARRLLFEYGRRNARQAPIGALSPHKANTEIFATLPHRPRNPETEYDASNAADIASEDEGFAIIHRSQATGGSTPHTQMSSPELVPTTSNAQTMADDKATSDDEWSML